MTSKQSDIVIVEMTKSEADGLPDALSVVATSAAECALEHEWSSIGVVEWLEQKLGKARDKAAS